MFVQFENFSVSGHSLPFFYNLSEVHTNNLLKWGWHLDLSSVRNCSFLMMCSAVSSSSKTISAQTSMYCYIDSPESKAVLTQIVSFFKTSQIKFQIAFLIFQDSIQQKRKCDPSV